jgi:hypothetical protein
MSVVSRSIGQAMSAARFSGNNNNSNAGNLSRNQLKKQRQQQAAQQAAAAKAAAKAARAAASQPMQIQVVQPAPAVVAPAPAVANLNPALRFSNINVPKRRSYAPGGYDAALFGSDVYTIAQDPGQLAALEQRLVAGYNIPTEAQIYTDAENYINQNAQRQDAKIKGLVNNGEIDAAAKTFGKLWRTIMKDEPGSLAGTSKKTKTLARQARMAANPLERAQAQFVKRQFDEVIRRVKIALAKTVYNIDIQKVSVARYDPDPNAVQTFNPYFSTTKAARVAKLAQQNRIYTQAMKDRDDAIEKAFTNSKTYYAKPKKPRTVRFGDVDWTDPMTQGYIDVDGRNLDANVFGQNYANMKYLRLEDDDGKMRRLPGYAQKALLPYSGPKDPRYLVHLGQAEISKAIQKQLEFTLGDADLAKRIKIDKDVLYVIRAAEEAVLRKLVYALIGSYLHLESTAQKPKLRLGLEHFYHLMKSTGGQDLIQNLQLLNFDEIYDVTKKDPQTYFQEDELTHTDYSQEIPNWQQRLPALKPKKKWFDTIQNPQTRKDYFITGKQAGYVKRHDAYNQAYAQTAFDNLTVAEWAASIGKTAFNNKAAKYAKKLDDAVDAASRQSGITDRQTLEDMVLATNPTLKALNDSNFSFQTALQNQNPYYTPYLAAQAGQTQFTQLKNQYFPQKPKLNVHKDRKHLTGVLAATLKQQQYKVDKVRPLYNQIALIPVFVGWYNQEVISVLQSVNGLPANSLQAFRAKGMDIVTNNLMDYFGQQSISTMYTSAETAISAFSTKKAMGLGNKEVGFLTLEAVILALNTISADVTMMDYDVNKLQAYYTGNNPETENIVKDVIELPDADASLSWSGYSQDLGYASGELITNALRKEYNQIVKTAIKRGRVGSNSIKAEFGDTVMPVTDYLKSLMLVLSLDVNNPYFVNQNSSGDNQLLLGKALDKGFHEIIDGLIPNHPNLPNTGQFAQYLLKDASLRSDYAQFPANTRMYQMTEDERKQKKQDRRIFSERLKDIRQYTPAF